MMAKRNLFCDTVLRRDGSGAVYLMNRQEGGWRQWAEPVESVSAFSDAYNAQVGAWARDKYGEYCPVHALEGEKKVIPPVGTKPVVIVDGLNVLTGYSLMGDGEVLEPSTFVPHDVGPRGQVPVDDLSGELQRLIDGTLTYEQVRELASDPDTTPPAQVSEQEVFKRYYKDVYRGPNMLDDSYEFGLSKASDEIGPGGPVLVGDEITPETVRELARGRAGYSSALTFDRCYGTDLTKLRDQQAFAMKASLTDEQVAAIDEQLVPVFAKGEVLPPFTGKTLCYKHVTDPVTGQITTHDVPETHPGEKS
jgi:hypothetical protein